jgi:hypothetical protein
MQPIFWTGDFPIFVGEPLLGFDGTFRRQPFFVPANFRFYFPDKRWIATFHGESLA